MNPIVLVGAGGHCRACIDVIESTGQYEIAAIVGQEAERGQNILGYPVTNVDDELPKLVESHRNFLITIGQIKTNAARVKLYESIKRLGGEFPTIVSRLAYVSPHATLGEGSIAMHFATLNAGAKVGNNCIINSKALIEHDVQIGDHCHISTGAIINGGAVIEDNCFVGSGALAHQGILVGNGTIIGSRALVVRDVSSETLIKSNHHF